MADIIKYYMKLGAPKSGGGPAGTTSYQERRIVLKQLSLTTIIVALAVMVLFIWGAYIAGVASASAGQGRDALFLNQLSQIRSQRTPDLVKKAMKMLDEEYYKPIDEATKEKMMYGAVEGLVGVLREKPYNDSFSHFYDPQLYEDLQAQTTGEYAGVGILMGITADGMYPEVSTVFDGTPAEEAGILEADIITEVDGESTFGMILPEVATRIKGEPGTAVHMQVFRPDESDYLEFDVTRRDVHFSSVSDTQIDKDKIGYIRINNFAEQTGQDFRVAVEKLMDQGMQGLVIDLRNNPGGLFQAAIDVANCFVDGGEVIVRTYYRNTITPDMEGNGDVTTADPDVKKYHIPLVVLINQDSASASEILVGALKDHGLAKVVGERSYGKGLIQAVNPMDYETEERVDKSGEKYKQKVVHSALALTIGKYLTPDKHDIHMVGIQPNIWHTVDNRLATEPKLIELNDEIQAKVEELRKLRTDLSAYLRDNDVVRDLGISTADKLVQGEPVPDVPKMEPPEEEPTPLAESSSPQAPESEGEGSGQMDEEH